MCHRVTGAHPTGMVSPKRFAASFKGLFANGDKAWQPLHGAEKVTKRQGRSIRERLHLAGVTNMETLEVQVERNPFEENSIYL